MEEREVLPPQRVFRAGICADEVTDGAVVHPISPVLLNEGGDGLPAVPSVNIDAPRIPVLEVVIAGLPSRIAEVIKADDPHLWIGLQEYYCGLAAVEAHLNSHACL